MFVQSETQLRKIYDYPKGRAKDKQLDSLERHSVNFIAHSTFVAISTHAKSG